MAKRTDAAKKKVPGPVAKLNLTFKPATASRWQDVETLFGERGACGGCWCMWWRLPRAEFVAKKGPKNKAAFRQIVDRGPPPGVIAYMGAQPVGWCAVAPRETYVRLGTARSLKPVDAQPVWSITCMFVLREFRRRGVSVKLLEAAAAFAKKSGAKCVEGYPVESRKGTMPDAFAWTGLVSAFRRAGFSEARRPSATRAIVRRTL